ncbi:MAG TPA: hypothetical protein VMV10_23845 [Pirellulales bacterium]|nr:hypothetical protein [Pirellulales bacterium]HVA45905.1 hypothetical protein [Pirellulales bacterium]
MTADELASQSLLCWIDAELSTHRALARQELPKIDLPYFFAGLSQLALPGPVSLALVDFDADMGKLVSLRKKYKANGIMHLSDDLHMAGSWRNSRASHPFTVALARGRHPGVNTLQHQEQVTSGQLVRYLLSWTTERAPFVKTSGHRKLLEVLTDDVLLAAFSFEQIRAFLATWATNEKKHGSNAPRASLPALGLFADPALFELSPGPELRLQRNLETIRKIRDLGAGSLTALRKRVDKSRGSRLRTILAKIETVRREPTVAKLADVTLADALELLNPQPERNREPPAEPETEVDEALGTLDDRTLPRAAADALLDDRRDDLRANAETLAERLRDAIQGDDTDDEVSGEVLVAGEPQEFSTRLDRKFVGWIHKFCSGEVWGGLVQTNQPDLARALADYDRPGTRVTNPEELTVDAEGSEQLGLSRFFKDWDQELERLTGKNPTISVIWREFVERRSELLPDLDMLAHFPLDWFAGNSKAAKTAEKYLNVAGQLYGSVAANYDRMSGEVDQHWARTTLDGLLALDVVQVRVELGRGEEAFKAVLLPTHPLHLWRYCRLSAILRGLGKSLPPEDRRAVLEEVGEPQQFLSVIYASRFPGNRGADRILPVSSDIHRLATFENLRNACQSEDGQQSLAYAVERFAAIHRQHVFPLRLVLLNPPHAGKLLLGLLKLLDGRKRDFIPNLCIEIRGTPEHAGRLHEALPFDTRERDLLEERIASGRLELRVDRQPKPLLQHLAALKDNPCHLLAVFDESSVSIRRGGAGLHLPMSPFCVRRNPKFDKFQNALRLEPADTDPPFGEFLKLLNKAEGAESEGNSYAWGDAQGLREAVDGTVCGDEFAARWFFLADRALPAEGGMNAKRLLRRREGQRHVLLTAGDYLAMVRLMRPVFEEDAANLLVSVPQLETLLAEGAHLVGGGVLDLVKSSDGTIVKQKVIGLMGLLLAARDHRRRHPASLVVSTDSQLARLWLRLGQQGLGEMGQRCDLLALREENRHLVIECLEVKSSLDSPLGATDSRIGEARDQVLATLEAVRDGLSGVSPGGVEATVLTAPRCEMIKEVFVAGSMSRHATKEQRAVWADWLMRLFRPSPALVELRGRIVGVWIRSSQRGTEERLADAPYRIDLRHLGEREVEELLAGDGGPPKDDDQSGLNGSDLDEPPCGPPSGSLAKSSSSPNERATHAVASSKQVTRSAKQPASALTSSILLGRASDDSSITWEPSIAGNPHLLVAGQPGTGKTTCLVNICCQFADHGVMPIVFDFHGDIEAKLAPRIPRMVRSGMRSLGFNPMRVPMHQIHGHVEAAGLLRDIFSAVFPDLGDLQLEALRTAIKLTFEAKGWPIGVGKKQPESPEFGEFLGYLRSLPKKDAGTRALLARLTELDDYDFFDSHVETPSMLDQSQPVVIQLHQTQNEAVQRAFAAFTFYRLYQDMHQRGQQDRITHSIIFDEAHRAAKLKLIPTMAKECRKFGLSLILASQESRDFDRSLFGNIANYLLLRVTEDTARHLAKNALPSGRQRAITDKLKQLPKYEALWLCEGRKSPVHIRLSPK